MNNSETMPAARTISVALGHGFLAGAGLLTLATRIARV